MAFKVTPDALAFLFRSTINCSLLQNAMPVETGCFDAQNCLHFCSSLVLSLFAFPPCAAPAGLRDPLLDHMTGWWVLRGIIEGKDTTHDVTIEWVPGHQCLRILIPNL
jgi:hypothetical protein